MLFEIWIQKLSTAHHSKLERFCLKAWNSRHRYRLQNCSLFCAVLIQSNFWIFAVWISIRQQWIPPRWNVKHICLDWCMLFLFLFSFFFLFQFWRILLCSACVERQLFHLPIFIAPSLIENVLWFAFIATFVRSENWKSRKNIFGSQPNASTNQNKNDYSLMLFFVVRFTWVLTSAFNLRRRKRMRI